MSSPPDYDAEHTPLITDVSDVDDSQMCKQLLRWLDENNLGNQDLISVSSLKDGLKKTVSQAVSDNGKTGSFGYNKCHKNGATIRELLQNFKTYLVGIAIIIALSAVELAFLFSEPFIGIAVALSTQAVLAILFLLLATYWWGRRGPPLASPTRQYLKVPSTGVARANMEYYA